MLFHFFLIHLKNDHFKLDRMIKYDSVISFFVFDLVLQRRELSERLNEQRI